MPKTTTFTTITPLPSGITRKSVLDMYEDHMAMIDLNPLVVERFKCRPPSYAPAEEYFAAWYTIKDKVSYLPGGLAQGSVSYHACFHDTPEGLSTHVYAPLGLDIRGKWSVGGSLPGEPKQPAEKGLNIPRHGIYIREDVTMTCSSLLMGFVKRTFKDSHAALVEKLVEKAHLLESNFANERLRALRNVSPGERMAIGNIFIAPPPDYRPWGYISPYPQSPQLPSPSPRVEPASAPTPSPLLRTQTLPSPHYSPPAHSHSRSHSDPITSPGFSSSSTLVSDEPDRPPTPPKDVPIVWALTNPDPPTPAPESNMYLLPSTTYNGAPSPNTARNDRLISLHPAGTEAHARKESNISIDPPHISYTPNERPITFSSFAQSSPFDTRSRTASTTSSNHNILDEIDDAIDQVFLFTVPSRGAGEGEMGKDEHDEEGVEEMEMEMVMMAAVPGSARELAREKEMARGYDFPTPPTAAKEKEKEVLPATTYEPFPSAQVKKECILPATKYEPEQKAVVLPSTTYTPTIGRARKDSVVPWTDKELPPVPIDG